jgi:4-amino-4-deoxy-L-arabinose transferase-like glycosyltransferase
LGADFLRFLVVVGFLAYVFIGVSYATMGPQSFFPALAHIAAIASKVAMFWVQLFGLFEDYVQRTFKRLTNLLAIKGSGGGLDKVG